MSKVRAAVITSEVSEPTGLTQEVVDSASERLKVGDRAGAYLDLYQATGNELYLVQAQITTYSGSNGGLALGVNQAAKVTNPELYDIPLDTFSHNIDATLIQNAQNWIDGVEGAGDPSSVAVVLAIDTLVWENNGRIPNLKEEGIVLTEFNQDTNISGSFGGGCSTI